MTRRNRLSQLFLFPPTPSCGTAAYFFDTFVIWLTYFWFLLFYWIFFQPLWEWNVGFLFIYVAARLFIVSWLYIFMFKIYFVILFFLEIDCRLLTNHILWSWFLLSKVFPIFLSRLLYKFINTHDKIDLSMKFVVKGPTLPTGHPKYRKHTFYTVQKLFPIPLEDIFCSLIFASYVLMSWSVVCVCVCVLTQNW